MGRIADLVIESSAVDGEHGAATEHLLKEIAAAQPRFDAALTGTELDPTQFISNAVNVIRQDLLDPDKKTKIIECVPESVIGALLNCAQHGLRPGPFKEAWLIPKRKRDGAVLCEFQAHYRGLLRMALAHPDICLIETEVAYKADKFIPKKGSAGQLIYEPKVAPLLERGPRVAFYALAKLVNGQTPYVWWHDADMAAFRNKFIRAGDRSPWYDGYGYTAMGKKTMLLRLLDEIPRLQRLIELVAIDGTVRRDIDPATPGHEVSEHVDDEEPIEVTEPDVPNLDELAQEDLPAESGS